MLRIYRAPDGRTYQYEEGEQPDGYAEVKPEAKPKARGKAPANKARSAARNKARTSRSKGA